MTRTSRTCLRVRPRRVAAVGRLRRARGLGRAPRATAASSPTRARCPAPRGTSRRCAARRGCPRSESSSARRWSDSGCAASSLARISRSRCLHGRRGDVHAVEVRYPPEKKCLSSNSPYGVAMYLPVTPRLTVDRCTPISTATSSRRSGRSGPLPSSKNSSWTSRMICAMRRHGVLAAVDVPDERSPPSGSCPSGSARSPSSAREPLAQHRAVPACSRAAWARRRSSG